MMNFKTLLTIPLIVSLGGCISSNDILALTQDDEGLVSVIITDDLTQDYAEVWVSILDITATNPNGTQERLFHDANGDVHNLSQLASIGALLDNRLVGSGSYTDIQVVVANEIKLVTLDGTTINAQFDQTGQAQFTIPVAGSFTVSTLDATALVLDFDLQQFTYDAQTNTVDPVIVQSDLAHLRQNLSNTLGRIESVNADGTVTLSPTSGGANITIDLHAGGTVTNVTTGTVAGDTSSLQTGMQIHVSGSYDVESQHLSALSIEIDTDSATPNHELEGVVSSFDGSTLTLDVKEASFLPTSNTLTVGNISNALFSKGSLDLLTTGQKVDIKGQWDGTTFTATIVEIEGATTQASQGDSSYADQYAEIDGTIMTIADNQLTIGVTGVEQTTTVTAGSELVLDISNSWWEQGSASCIQSGDSINAKGAINGDGSMAVNVIKVESGCALTSSDSSSGDSSSDGTNTSTESEETDDA